MNNQEAFDKVLKHLREQGKAAVRVAVASDGTKNEECCYRGPDGTMCAVGCLIPDEEYDSELEGMAVDQIPQHLMPKSLRGLDEDLLCSLQTVHDYFLRTQGVHDWEKYMSRIAERYILKYTPPH